MALPVFRVLAMTLGVYDQAKQGPGDYTAEHATRRAPRTEVGYAFGAERLGYA